MTKCHATTRAGKPCRQRAVYADGKCLYHSSTPEAAQLRRQAQSLGGRATQAKLKAAGIRRVSKRELNSPEALLRECERLLSQLLAGKVDAKTAAAATRLIREARAAYELSVVEEKLRKLEMEDDSHEHDPQTSETAGETQGF